MTTRQPPWKKANPTRKTATSRKLTPAQKATAEKAAKKAGRRYPNLVDNMRVAANANRTDQKKSRVKRPKAGKRSAAAQAR
jgi:hypothetical protein